MSDADRDALEQRIKNIEAELELSKAQLAEVNKRDGAKPKDYNDTKLSESGPFQDEPAKPAPKPRPKPVAKK